MGQFRNLTSEEAAKLDPKEIGKGIPAGEGEVEAQDRMVHCHQCKAHYYTKVNYRYTICPNCGHIMEWTY